MSQQLSRKLLPAIVLIFSLSIGGCGIFPNRRSLVDGTGEGTAETIGEGNNSIPSKIKTVEREVSDFRLATSTLSLHFQKLVAGANVAEDFRPNLVEKYIQDRDNLKSSLEALRKPLLQLEESEEELSSVWGQLNETLNSIDKVFAAFKDGINDRETTKEIQKHLKEKIDNLEIDEEESGTLGPQTASAIEDFRKQEVNEVLADQISTFKGFAEGNKNGQRQPDDSPLEVLESEVEVMSERIPILKEQIQILKEEKEQSIISSEEADQSPIDSWLIGIVALGFGGVGGVILGIKFSNPKRNQRKKRKKSQITEGDQNSIPNPQTPESGWSGSTQQFTSPTTSHTQQRPVSPVHTNPDVDQSLIPDRESPEKETSSTARIEKSQPTLESEPDSQPSHASSRHPSQTLEERFVNEYNRCPHKFRNKFTIISVSESESTMKSRRRGQNTQPILEETNNANYWAMAVDDEYYLVPKAGFRVNEHNYKTLQVFFNCAAHQSGGTVNFTLIKPAKLISQGNQSWLLEDKGQLRFSH